MAEQRYIKIAGIGTAGTWHSNINRKVVSLAKTAAIGKWQSGANVE